MTVVSVELEDTVAFDVRQLAALLQSNEEDIIRTAGRNHLRRLRTDQIRAQTQPYFKAAGFLSEEDIYPAK